MTADDEFFAAVCRQFGRPAPSPPRRDEVRTITAGIISSPRIVLATLRCVPGRAPRVIDQASRSFEIDNRSASAVLRLSNDLERFVRRQGVSEIFLRSLSERGKFAGHPLNFKIEAVLQMISDLRVTFVSTFSVGAWVKRDEPKLPDGGEKCSARWAEKQRLAIETAMFVAVEPTALRSFSDGSGSND
ncbi:DUF3010 family protein [Novosphingobium sp. MMS21-SN21R]|uniref:DUF3010 family protein n=1 Tax=Novosphingobium sp. MMS21-SN21R TaxID=2969298 RepID=UPI002887A213|nr:DUF3010 family protein [Novosphingobium sp. MMS21-SN21R]MDT0506924.1 DUF3010 family protein [Novosphingobium sp. MMS21-SN21R]